MRTPLRPHRDPRLDRPLPPRRLAPAGCRRFRHGSEPRVHDAARGRPGDDGDVRHRRAVPGVPRRALRPRRMGPGRVRAGRSAGRGPQRDRRVRRAGVPAAGAHDRIHRGDRGAARRDDRAGIQRDLRRPARPAVRAPRRDDRAGRGARADRRRLVRVRHDLARRAVVRRGAGRRDDRPIGGRVAARRDRRGGVHARLPDRALLPCALASRVRRRRARRRGHRGREVRIRLVRGERADLPAGLRRARGAAALHAVGLRVLVRRAGRRGGGRGADAGGVAGSSPENHGSRPPVRLAETGAGSYSPADLAPGRIATCGR